MTGARSKEHVKIKRPAVLLVTVGALELFKAVPDADNEVEASQDSASTVATVLSRKASERSDPVEEDSNHSSIFAFGVALSQASPDFPIH